VISTRWQLLCCRRFGSWKSSTSNWSSFRSNGTRSKIQPETVLKVVAIHGMLPEAFDRSLA